MNRRSFLGHSRLVCCGPRGCTEAHTGSGHCSGTGWLTRWQARALQFALSGEKGTIPVCPALQVGAASERGDMTAEAGLLGSGQGGIASETRPFRITREARATFLVHLT